MVFDIKYVKWNDMIFLRLIPTKVCAPSPCITRIWFWKKCCFSQILCYPDYVVNIWLKEDSFTYALCVIQGPCLFWNLMLVKFGLSSKLTFSRIWSPKINATFTFAMSIRNATESKGGTARIPTLWITFSNRSSIPCKIREPTSASFTYSDSCNF